MSNSGARQHKLTVMRLPGDESSWGEPNTEPADRFEVTKIWVSIVGQSGMEIVRSGQEVSVARYSLRGNYRTDIRAQDELWAGDGTRYRVITAIPDRASKQKTDYVCEVVQ